MGPIYYKFTSEHFFQKQEVYGAGRTWHGLLLFIALMIELLFNTLENGLTSGKKVAF